jgi:hypothetical protein
MELKYLGVNITSSGNLAEDIKTQARRAGSVAGGLNSFV